MITVTKKDGIWFTRLKDKNGRTKTFSVFDTKREAMAEKKRLIKLALGIRV